MGFQLFEIQDVRGGHFEKMAFKVWSTSEDKKVNNFLSNFLGYLNFVSDQVNYRTGKSRSLAFRINQNLKIVKVGPYPVFGP